jgi:hypothetical protein
MFQYLFHRSMIHLNTQDDTSSSLSKTALVLVQVEQYTIYGLTRVPYPMENPTARETTQATSPAPYPITVASSTSAA